MLLSLAWGSSFMFIKIGVTHTGPMTLVAGRLLIGWVAVSLLMLRSSVGLPRQKAEWGHLLFLGIINTALPIFLISWGEQEIDSGMAAVVNSTVPIWTVLLAHLILRDEKLTAGRLLGVGIGFGGVLVLVGLPEVIIGNQLLAGQAAVIAAAICYSASAIYIRKFVPDLPYLRIIWVSLLSAWLLTAAAALALEKPDLLHLHRASLLAMAWLGLIGTALAYQLYYRLLAWWGAGRATSVTYTFPVIGLLLGITIWPRRTS
ncbi:MAG: EamA family transporter [Candidatus Marinimicrobia bacterium]|nr:EamA family transporter [Candidatus Neomarinimicrobiota bacterium]